MNLPNNLNGRSLTESVIPTVSNLKNTLEHLFKNKWNVSELSDWDKRTYRVYHLEEILPELEATAKEFWPMLMRVHILGMEADKIGPNCIDIYLVGYVSEVIGIGRDIFFQYIYSNNISNKQNSAQAIWQVGKGDGEYLGVLKTDGSIKDVLFFERWIR